MLPDVLVVKTHTCINTIPNATGPGAVSYKWASSMPKMNKTKFLKGACEHCGGHLEFLAEHIGMVIDCPHCGKETELALLPPPEEPTVPRRALVWTAIAVVVLGLGLGGAMLALKRAQNW